MPDTVQLVRRDGVELVRTGSWALSTGQWQASREDLAAAVAATACPAIRRPVIWIGHTDQRFTPRDSGQDGEPGVGWIENLRLADGGHTLLGDYVGMPDWLGQVMASAYPDRSVEGAYNRRCQLGHTHRFVLDGVALLGVTRPGVGTLRSLQTLEDVRSLYGLAASTSPDGEVRVTATITEAEMRAAAEQYTGAMVALIPSEADAARLAVEGGEPADQLHVTLAYLGDAVALSAADRQDVIDAVSSAVNGFPIVDADIFALSVFNPSRPDRDTCIVAGLSGDLLDAAHTLVGDALNYSEVSTPAQHAPWHAHMTLRYTDDLSQVAALTDRVGPVRFDRIRIALAGQHIDIPLVPDEPETDDVDDSLAVAAAAGDGNALKRYWTRGEGLKRWATRKHPWTALYRQLRKHVGAERAKRMTSKWFHEVFGIWSGHRKGRNKTGPG